MEDIKKTIGKNLQELRKMKKYTQQDLANELQYSDKAISKWEKGESLPDIEILYQICNLYGVTLDFLTHEGSYAEKKEYVIPRYELRNKVLVTLLVSSLVWLAVLLSYIYILQQKQINFWPAFIWGIPANCLILWYLNLKWGRRILNLPILSVFGWSLLAGIFLTGVFDGSMFWQIFLIGIPYQVALVLWSQIKH